MGLDAASLGHSAIERAVDQRAAAWYADGHAEATLTDYWEATQGSPAMLQALIETVVVPETWFYRDADAFKALARLAHERLAGRGTALPLRILSLPCSTGEEPYTIAMTLLDAGIEAAQLRIDAMDISDRSLAIAQSCLWDGIEATRSVQSSELWSWRYAGGRYRVEAFGASGGDADESNAAQLCSTVYLALKRPAAIPGTTCPAA